MNTYDILKNIRERRGLNIGAVADTSAISPKRLADIENGVRSPSRKQAERLAEIYGVSLFTLFSKDIPNLPPLPQDFRKEKPSPAQISPKGMKAFWAVEQVSHFARQLAVEVKFERHNLLKETLAARDTVSRATYFRHLFDEWFYSREADLNLAGSAEVRFLNGLKLFFEAQGNVANSNDAPSPDYLGFFVTPDGGEATIFVNRSVQSKKAQLFTLAHELAHWLIGADGISDPFLLKNSIERSCNMFAAEFLAPLEAFKSLAEEVPAELKHDVHQHISFVSARCLLSKHATAIRLVEAGYLTRAQLSEWEQKWRRYARTEKEEENANAELKGGHAHAKRMSEIGTYSVYLAAVGIEKKLIDKYDVVSGIGLAESIQEKAFSLARRRIETALR